MSKSFKIEILSNGTPADTIVKMDGKIVGGLESVRFSANVKKKVVDFSIKKIMVDGKPIVAVSSKDKRNKK